MTPPALTGDGATYTDSRTHPTTLVYESHRYLAVFCERFVAAPRSRHGRDRSGDQLSMAPLDRRLRELGVVGGFVGLVAVGFELEGAVVDVEVIAEAFAESVEDFAGAAGGEAVGIDDDVSG